MEPVSVVIGMIGFSATLFNFLLTSISNFAAAKRRLEDIRPWYRECTALLEESKQIIESWARLWCQPGYSAATYTELWSTSGYNDIKMRILEIETTTRDIMRLLKFENEDGRAPSFWLPNLESHTTSMAKQEWIEAINTNGYWPALHRLRVNVVTKIAFTLYKEMAIKEKAGRLKTYVMTLETHSIRLYKNSHNWWEGSTLEISDINSSLKYNEIVKTAQELNTVCRQDDCNSQWALELSGIENGTEVKVSTLEGIRVLNFVVAFPRQPDVDLNTTHINVRTTRFLPVGTGLVSEKQRAVAHVLNQPRAAYQRADGMGVVCEQTDGLNSRFRWKPSLSKELLAMKSDGVAAKASERQRANIACALSVHLIALWSTGWVTNICSCAIRKFYHTEQGESKYALRAYCRIPDALDCQRGYRPEHRLLLLGVVISELVLGRPLPLEYHGEGPPTILNFGEHANEKTFHDIAWEVHQVGGRQIGSVVEFCFDSDRDWGVPNLHGEEVKILLEQVVQPVHRYARAIQNGPDISGPQPPPNRGIYQRFYDLVKQYALQLYQSDQDSSQEEYPQLIEECHSIMTAGTAV